MSTETGSRTSGLPPCAVPVSMQVMAYHGSAPKPDTRALAAEAPEAVTEAPETTAPKRIPLLACETRW